MRRFKDRERIHEPVMVHEVLEFLNLKAPLKTQAHVVDATLGTGGHAIEIVKTGAKVLGIDLDAGLLKIAKERLTKACLTMHRRVHGCFKLVQGNFRNIDKIARNNDFTDVDAILFDLGISSVHFASASPVTGRYGASRGFSFSDRSAPLDMRLDPEGQAVTAADLLNVLPKGQLERLFGKVLSKVASRKLVGRIILAREKRKIKTAGDFLQIVGKEAAKARLHPATLAFLALRIAVNSELENLREALPKAFRLLKKGGRLAVLSFHSGEDAVAKDLFRKMEKEEKASVLTKKPVLPSNEEVKRNPKARSAKLRAISKAYDSV